MRTWILALLLCVAACGEVTTITTVEVTVDEDRTAGDGGSISPDLTGCGGPGQLCCYDVDAGTGVCQGGLSCGGGAPGTCQ